VLGLPSLSQRRRGRRRGRREGPEREGDGKGKGDFEGERKSSVAVVRASGVGTILELPMPPAWYTQIAGSWEVTSPAY
jgi:hypothetical protein